MTDRNAEIWSTRLQREILALETPTDDDSKKLELLPPFITTVGHTMNIEGGIAKIEFRIDVELTEDDVGVGDGVSNKEVEGGDTTAEGKGATNTTTGEGEMDAEKTVESELEKKDDTNAAEDEKEQSTDTTTSNTTDQPHVILVLDASMYWKPDSNNNNESSSTNNHHPTSYPFQKPLAVVKYGSHLFSGGSTIRNGDEVDIDLDWTPSIHLSDAVTNVALKIRECVKRGEPLHASAKEEGGGEGDDEEGLLSGALLREAREAKESLLETKKAVGAMFSSFGSGIAARGSSFAAKGQSIGKGFLSSTLGESLSSLAKDSEDVAQDSATEKAKAEEEKKVVKSGLPSIGDEIDLSDEPWNNCIGMYSCKAIKRPAFVESAMEEAARKQSKAKEIASPMFATTGSMFSRFAQSAKSVMEESFLMITEQYLVEFKSNRLNIGSGTVTFAIKIDNMAKLKFRREESLSLFFKAATDDPLVYMCLDSALAVQDIQNVLKSHGVKGKHTNAATQRAVQMALNMVQLIQQKEAELIDNPNVDRVNEIMDLYRQAAEKFEQAGDPRHTEVMAHMKRFLNQAFTTSILDGSFVTPESVVPASPEKADAKPVPVGEILEQPSYNLSNDEDDDDDDDIVNTSVSSHGTNNSEPPATPDKLNDSTMQHVEDMFEEAKRDMGDLGLGDDDINNILNSPDAKSVSQNDDDNDDTFAELDAMLSDADAELNELLAS
ncbi:predicted protein [Thalassiosira pseudonana CCMP1335]|uniref:Uncharacterized protein n=1 Tax=Thalassiosira pseudonana TaxID=35128 RepID=B8BS43_THAPS|nr:predicted protein [Thalassiosira pseudonana CCMP1335]EED96656.1 predicted protein [Thalassiosira pseudonana CCMP1335]